MNKIDYVNQIKISRVVIAQILKKYTIEEFFYEIIKEGIENTSLIIKTNGEQFVLRIYRRLKKTDQMIHQEIEFQEFLKTKYIPVPCIISNSNNEKLTIIETDRLVWQAVLMQYMGKTDFISYSRELISELATIQAKMHLLGFSFAKNQKRHERVLEELHETIAERNTITEIKEKNSLDFLERGKEFFLSLSPNLPHGYNHLDYDTHGNVLVKDNKVTAILDFDDLSYSPCVVCLGYTLWHVIFDSNDTELAKQYVIAYEKVRHLSKEEKSVLPQVILFRNYAIGAIELTVRKRYKYIQLIMNLEKVIKNLNFDDE